MTTDQKTVVVILYPGCIFLEVALALELVSEKYRIIAATPDGKPHAASNGLEISKTVRYTDFQPEQCEGVLVPGGNPDSISENKDVMQLLRSANDKKCVIAAICAGPSVLGKAGILRGRRIAHGYGPKQLEFLREIFADVVVTDESLIWDDSILTAKPSAHIDFAVEFANRLGVVANDNVRRLKDYYKGVSSPKISVCINQN